MVTISAALREVKRSASLWRSDWMAHSDGGKRENQTQSRLEQAVSGEFGWKDVLDW